MVWLELVCLCSVCKSSMLLCLLLLLLVKMFWIRVVMVIMFLIMKGFSCMFRFMYLMGVLSRLFCMFFMYLFRLVM